MNNNYNSQIPDTLSVVQFKDHWSRLSNEVGILGREFTVCRHGKPVVKVLPVDQFTEQQLAKLRQANAVVIKNGFADLCVEIEKKKQSILIFRHNKPLLVLQHINEEAKDA